MMKTRQHRQCRWNRRKSIDSLLASRRTIHEAYQEAFDGCDKILFPNPAQFSKRTSRTSQTSHTSHTSLIPNYAYCPTFFRDEATREKVYNTLHEYNVFTRRYFYPLFTDFAPYIYGKGGCPIAEDLGKRVLPLPTCYGLTPEDATEIDEMIKEIVK